MNAINFQWVSMAMFESIDVSGTAQFAVSVSGIDIEANIAEGLAALMAMKRTTASANLNEEFRKVLQSLDILIQKMAV
jgi:hypothetical protein